jgi:hypothetical protein
MEMKLIPFWSIDEDGGKQRWWEGSLPVASFYCLSRARRLQGPE